MKTQFVSCGSTTAPPTEMGTMYEEEDSNYYVPFPAQIEGPRSSVVRTADPLVPKYSAAPMSMRVGSGSVDLVPLSAIRSSSSSRMQSDASQLTVVSSVATGDAVVPPPRTKPAVVPECASWAGDAYGQAVAQEKDVPFVQEKIVYKPVKQVIHRPVEKPVYVKKPIRKEVVEFKQVVTDEVIEVPKKFEIETEVFVPRYVNHDTTCAVAQTYLPRCSVDRNHTPVSCVRYEPEIRIVDVNVPKIVHGKLAVKSHPPNFKSVGKLSQAQWNALVLKINPELCRVGDLNHLPVYRNSDGTVLAFKPEEAVGAPLISLEQHRQTVLSSLPS